MRPAACLVRLAVVVVATITAACADPSSSDAGPDASTPADASAPPADAQPYDTSRPPGTIRVIQFNTGTTAGVVAGREPTAGYGEPEAALSDAYYGDGLAWQRAIDDTRAFLAAMDPDVVVFQEIFDAEACPDVPADARAGFVCETWSPGDPTVARLVLGSDYQIACNLEKPDKCTAVHRRLGTIRGCGSDLCYDALAGARVPDCGSGSRVGRALVDLASGGTLTIATVHGSSGVSDSDAACRAQQFAQVFEDLGDGSSEPAASGSPALILGDLNTDPVRLAASDPSAAYFLAHTGEGRRFHFVTDVGRGALPTYAGLFTIDHVLSDTLDGCCFHPGITPGTQPPTDMRYFDHRPAVCDVTAP